jgi:hypothetical protein
MVNIFSSVSLMEAGPPTATPPPSSPFDCPLETKINPEVISDNDSEEIVEIHDPNDDEEDEDYVPEPSEKIIARADIILKEGSKKSDRYHLTNLSLEGTPGDLFKQVQEQLIAFPIAPGTLGYTLGKKEYSLATKNAMDEAFQQYLDHPRNQITFVAKLQEIQNTNNKEKEQKSRSPTKETSSSPRKKQKRLSREDELDKIRKKIKRRHLQEGFKFNYQAKTLFWWVDCIKGGTWKSYLTPPPLPGELGTQTSTQTSTKNVSPRTSPRSSSTRNISPPKPRTIRNEAQTSVSNWMYIVSGWKIEEQDKELDVPIGTKVQVLDSDEDWRLCKTERGIQGWVPLVALRPVPPRPKRSTVNLLQQQSSQSG